MKFKDFTPEALGELLNYLAEHEHFDSIKALGSISQSEVRNAFLELAEYLRERTNKEITHQEIRYSDHKLSEKSLSLISCLSPGEEALLFKSFRLN